MKFIEITVAPFGRSFNALEYGYGELHLLHAYLVGWLLACTANKFSRQATKKIYPPSFMDTFLHSKSYSIFTHNSGLVLVSSAADSSVATCTSLRAF